MDKQKVDNHVDELIDVINQKQTEIDELVSCLNIALYGELTVDNEIKFNELIQKHTKK